MSIVTFTILPKEPLDDGGWKVLFPSTTVQMSLLAIGSILTLIWVFATYVRKVGEVSKLAVQRSIIFIVGFGIFFLFLKSLR